MLTKPTRGWLRGVSALLLLTGALDLAGCPGRVDPGEARRVVQAFYDRRLARRPVSELLAPELARTGRDYTAPSDPRPVAYRLLRVDRNGAIYRVSLILTSSSGTPRLLP